MSEGQTSIRRRGSFKATSLGAQSIEAKHTSNGEQSSSTPMMPTSSTARAATWTSWKTAMFSAVFSSQALIALVVFIVLEALACGLWWLGTRNMANANKSNALASASAIGSKLERMLALQQGGLFGGLIQLFNLAGDFFPPPRWTTGFNFFFSIFSNRATAGQPFFSLEALPKGIISNVFISDPTLANFTYSEMNDFQNNFFFFNQNILNPNNRPASWPSWATDLATINHEGHMSLLGPQILAPGLESKGLFMTLRLPLIYKDDGGWGLPNYTTTVCPPSVCEFSDGSSFLGFLQVKFKWQPFLDSLQTLSSEGLRFSLYTMNAIVPNRTAKQLLAVSNPAPDASDSACALITVLDWMTWEVCVYQPGGWTPQWTGALFAVFTVLALAISGLLFMVLRSRAEAIKFLENQKQMNRVLEYDKAIIEAKKEELEALTVRQFELLKHFAGNHQAEISSSLTPEESVSVLGNATSNFEEMIKSTKEQLASVGAAQMAEADKIVLLSPLGSGSYGSVHLGEWRGAQVAVKRMLLPHTMSSTNRAESMAVMEVAISSSVSHPNLVQLYTYRVTPINERMLSTEFSTGKCISMEGVTASIVTSPRNSDMSEAIAAFELLLVLEYCDRGSLRSILDQGPLPYLTILEYAMDIAKGMLHLHSTSILHLDLKAANILIKTVGQDGAALCKVADFGLAISLELDTHKTGAAAGTLTHMAPEILMEGKQGKPADVYAFGVVLYELYTARKPFGKIPRMTLGHKVVFEHLRPSFPPSTPPQYRILAEKCWHPDAASRPSFDQVLTELEQLTSISKSSKVGMHEISVQESIEEGVAVAHFAKEASFTSRKDKSTAGEEGSIDASVNASWFKNYELWRARAPAQLHQKP